MSIIACSIDGCDKPTRARTWCNRHYLRWYSTGSTDEPRRHDACAECGSAITSDKPKHGPSTKYCSPGCRVRANSITRRPDAYAATLAARRDATANKVRVKPNCLVCNEPFAARSANFRFCSQACNNKHLDLNNPKRCVEDDCDRGVRAKGMCSMHWRRKARAEGREANPAWDEGRKAQYHKRRARKRGTQVEDIRPIDIYERDIWLCGLCVTPVDPDCAWPDPMSPSLDHILPLSKGGTHTYENVQLAHLTCNVSKGNRTAA